MKNKNVETFDFTSKDKVSLSDILEEIKELRSDIKDMQETMLALTVKVNNEKRRL
tara:strand:+ start:288 stop:452 length:165 start_codon:yes stop_codon:yes gene_type:complete